MHTRSLLSGTPNHPAPQTRFSNTWWLLMAGVAALSALLFLSQLGGTGLVDETPPLFAAAARNMVESGDWLTPRVNGMPRFDKPILVYWLMGLGYQLLPPSLDPLGSLAARLPSALSATVVSLALADVLWCWPQQHGARVHHGGHWLVPLTASLGFGLSPMVLVWSRAALSDFLLTCLLTLSLLGFWQHWARRSQRLPVGPWVALGLAVLTKGPVALVLAGLTCMLFGCHQRKLGLLWRCLSPLKGLVLVMLVALPWYVAEFVAEGSAFIQAFFGYHNIQRFTQVVSGHSGPFWFYIPILLIGAMPQFPMALHSAWIGFARLHHKATPKFSCSPEISLRSFAACWLLIVVVFFTMATTKYLSYVLPAMPAIGLLVGLTAGDWQREVGRGRSWGAAWTSVALTAVVGFWLLTPALWVPLLDGLSDAPALRAELQTSQTISNIIARIGLIWLIAAGLTALSLYKRWWGWLLTLQLILVLWVPLGLLPLGNLMDQLNQAPLRVIAKAVQDESRSGEPLVMVGPHKPSLHFYAGRLVHYTDRSAQNLAHLMFCVRESTAGTMLVVLDDRAAKQPHWEYLQGTTIAEAGVYELRRLGRQALEAVVNQLQEDGVVHRDCPQAIREPLKKPESRASRLLSSRLYKAFQKPAEIEATFSEVP